MPSVPRDALSASCVRSNPSRASEWAHQPVLWRDAGHRSHSRAVGWNGETSVLHISITPGWKLTQQFRRSFNDLSLPTTWLFPTLRNTPPTAFPEPGTLAGSAVGHSLGDERHVLLFIIHDERLSRLFSMASADVIRALDLRLGTDLEISSPLSCQNMFVLRVPTITP